MLVTCARPRLASHKDTVCCTGHASIHGTCSSKQLMVAQAPIPSTHNNFWLHKQQHSPVRALFINRPPAKAWQRYLPVLIVGCHPVRNAAALRGTPLVRVVAADPHVAAQQRLSCGQGGQHLAGHSAGSKHRGRHTVGVAGVGGADRGLLFYKRSRQYATTPSPSN